MDRCFLSLLCAAAFFCLAMPGGLQAQASGFTYQGRLTDNGVPANGSYDLAFAVYGLAAGGNAISDSVTNAGLAVSNGLFTVTLDFGAEVFDGNPRWLDIAARTNGAADFVTLYPRQPLTPAPTAIFAATAGVARTVNGTIPGTALNGTYGSAVTFSNLANSFAGDGSGLVNVKGTVIPQLAAATTVQAVPNTSYVLTNSQPVTLTLPATATVGDVVRVAAVGSGGWTLAQNAGQSVRGFNLVNSLTPWTLLPGASVSQGYAMASSADGTHLIAVNSLFVQTSNDGGTTWTNPDSGFVANGIHAALSSDGRYEALVYPGGPPRISSDFGQKWTAQTNGPSTNYAGIAMSADGSRLVTIVNGGGIYISADYGTNWSLTGAPSNSWAAVTSSADGSRLAAVVPNGGIYISTNAGAAWALSSAPIAMQWTAITSSSDGSRIFAVNMGNPTAGLWISADFGKNWVASTAPGVTFTAVACSADGLRIATTVSVNIDLSVDGGLTWITTHAPVLSWHGLASSAAGNFFANGFNTGVYSFRTGTTSGANGHLVGTADSAIELEYVGSGQFLPVNHEGTFIIQ